MARVRDELELLERSPRQRRLSLDCARSEENVVLGEG